MSIVKPWVSLLSTTSSVYKKKKKKVNFQKFF